MERDNFIQKLENALGCELDKADRDYAWKLATTTSKTFEEILDHARIWVHEERRVAYLESQAAGYRE